MLLGDAALNKSLTAQNYDDRVKAVTCCLYLQ